MTVTGGNRVRAWATTIVVLLSTLLSGILSTSMVWPGSPTVCADVAVTVAVNPDHTPTAHLLDYRITAGQSHGPPALVDGLASRWHTYYVLAGDTPVLVHNHCGVVTGYTQHGAEQMARRGISEDMVHQTVATGRRTPGNSAGTTKYTGRNMWVVVNDSGAVVSVGWN